MRPEKGWPVPSVKIRTALFHRAASKFGSAQAQPFGRRRGRRVSESLAKSDNFMKTERSTQGI
jgi:hypothetical protein